MPHERSLIGVVEDDPVMGGTLVHRLELEGYHAVWWRTGQQALNGLRTSRPDLVVCDIRLPDISGEEMFLSVLPHLGGLPFLFVTAYRANRTGGPSDQSWSGRLHREALRASRSARPYSRLIAKRPGAAGLLGASQAMRQLELCFAVLPTSTARSYSPEKAAQARKLRRGSHTRFQVARAHPLLP